jgi:hypothetical protein
VYWFRVTVLLILRTRTTPDYAIKVAAANQLSFVQLREMLHADLSGAELAQLCESLHKDYGMLKYLLGHAATDGNVGYTAEQRMLMLNFRLVSAWFWAVARFRPAAARVALLEMATVLEYFANAMGQRFSASLASQPVRT